MLTQKMIIAFLFLLGIICLTGTFIGFYTNNKKKYKFDNKKKIEVENNTCDSCFAPIMQ